MEKIKIFKAHGALLKGTSGDQVYGDCPFCGKMDKFYVNSRTYLWDCKRCGRKGNIGGFLEEVNKANLKDISTDFLKKLAIDRKLPLKAFNGWEIGRTGTAYSIPIRNEKGVIQDIRIFKTGQRIKSTPACNSGLMGLNRLVKTPKFTPVFICEGEWDCVALHWLLKLLKKDGVVVGVPGATVFKREWVPFFEGRTVYSLYDNDDGGEQGEKLLTERLSGMCHKIYYTHWSSKLPKGFDIRDLIVQEAIKRKKPKKTYQLIMNMAQPKPRKSFGGPAPDTVEEKKVKPITLDGVCDVFKKWLYLKDTEGIKMALICYLSNMGSGEPIWMFIVSPPGGAKTEILSAFSKCEEAYITSSLTPHALISGASWTTGKDPSLIPDLNGMVLIIKDFTSIMSKRDVEKDEIFGIMRDAYDGKCGKVFGNGVRRSYESRFTVLAGVTPVIYELTSYHQSLGERFLKFTLGSNLQHLSEEDIIAKAINNLNKENTMREELSDAIYRFVYHARRRIEKGPLPTIPKDIQKQIIAAAQFGARMRGSVIREKYRPELIMSKPSAEVGSRLGKQLASIAVWSAVIHSRNVVNEEDYGRSKKTVLDTINQRNEDIVRTFIKECPTINDSLKTKEVCLKTRYTRATIARILDDMNLLNIVERSGKANAYEWTLSEYMRDLIKKANLYTTETEINRPLQIKKYKLRIKKKVTSEH